MESSSPDHKAPSNLSTERQKRPLIQFPHYYIQIIDNAIRPNLLSPNCTEGYDIIILLKMLI